MKVEMTFNDEAVVAGGYRKFRTDGFSFLKKHIIVHDLFLNRMNSLRTAVRVLMRDALDSVLLPSDPVIEEAAALIKANGIAAFPTETVYGLGGNAFSEKAVAAIYAAKKRPPEKPLSILVGTDADMETIAADIPEAARRLAEAFWPGPLTIVLNKKETVPDSVTRGLSTVGIRMPAHPVALALVRKTGPLACPSANISGNRAPRNASEVLEDLDGRIDMVIDGGETSLGTASTIIDMTKPIPEILRKGALPTESIRNVIGNVSERSE